MKDRTEPLTEVFPLRMSKSMLKTLRREATKKLIPLATYVRQIIDRRKG